MKYLYIAMFLQQVGREINEANIQKIFTALDIEWNNDEVRLLIPALSILTAENLKKAKQPVICEDSLKKEKVEAVIKPERIVKTEPMQPVECKEMDIKEDVRPRVVESSEITHTKPARYVYCITDKGGNENLGPIGIEGSEVYTIPYKDMCIIVHDCAIEPYQSEDEDVVKNWLFTQQEVLDVVGEKFGVVLPMSFDMIIEGKVGNDPEEEVKGWLEENYTEFYEKINRLRNKQEYGVQVILDTEVISEKLFETDEELRTKKKEIDTKPQGIAYMERELLKDLVKEKIEEKSDKYFKEFYSQIRECADDIVIGKVKKVGGNKQMIMNLSCLLHKDRVAELGKELEEMEKKDGVSVRFSGPWAPFSFVTPEKG